MYCYIMFTIPNNEVHTTDKGSISIIPPCQFTMDMYEIYCLKGNLFDDIERFYTKEEAMERINNLLQ